MWAHQIKLAVLTFCGVKVDFYEKPNPNPNSSPKPSPNPNLNPKPFKAMSFLIRCTEFLTYTVSDQRVRQTS